MELIWNEIGAERLVKRERTQLRVEGELPSPDGRTPTEVCGCKARVVIDSSAVETDEVKLTGRVIAYVTVIDPDGRLSSYESKAGFEHTVPIPGVGSGMSAEVSSSIQSVSAIPSESGVSMNADADMDVRIVTEIPVKVTGGISGINDLEIKTKTVTRGRKQSLGSASVRMREELAAEGVAEVISAEGQLMIRDVTLEQGSASVSGVLTVSAVTVDGGNRVSQLVRQVPFRERINVNAQEGDAFCQAELTSLYLHALGEDFALISMEAEVAFTVYSLTREELLLPVDAFSPTVGFGCLTERTAFISRLGSAPAQVTIKETLPLPDNLSEMAAPLFVSVRPIVTEAVPDAGGLSVSGLLPTSVTYESTSGRLVTFSEDVPFSSVIENAQIANMPVVTASCIASAVGTGERSVQIQYTLLLNAELIDVEEDEVVIGLAEREKQAPVSGIVICFASSGDEAFDIAKRYSVSRECVRSLNPDVPEPYAEGERLLLIV